MMCIFAQYKDIFGKPREGLHGIRLFDFAIVDIIMTIIAGALIGEYLGYNVILVILLLLLLSIPLHMLFGVDSKMIEILKSGCKVNQE